MILLSIVVPERCTKMPASGAEPAIWLKIVLFSMWLPAETKSMRVEGSTVIAREFVAEAPVMSQAMLFCSFRFVAAFSGKRYVTFDGEMKTFSDVTLAIAEAAPLAAVTVEILLRAITRSLL